MMLFVGLLIFSSVEMAHAQASGCTDPAATNYDPSVFFDDGSCVYPTGYTSGTAFGNVLRKENVEGFIVGIGNWFTGIVVAISTVMILYAAFLFVTAQDNDTQITKAKSTVFWGIVGLFVGLLASSLADIVSSYFS